MLWHTCHFYWVDRMAKAILYDNIDSKWREENVIVKVIAAATEEYLTFPKDIASLSLTVRHKCFVIVFFHPLSNNIICWFRWRSAHSRKIIKCQGCQGGKFEISHSYRRDGKALRQTAGKMVLTFLKCLEKLSEVKSLCWDSRRVCVRSLSRGSVSLLPQKAICL